MCVYMCGVGISFYSSIVNRGMTHWILEFNIFYACNSGIYTGFNYCILLFMVEFTWSKI